MAAKRHQPLYADASNTEITPLAKSLRERLQKSENLYGAEPDPAGELPAAPPVLRPVSDLREQRLSATHEAEPRHTDIDELEPLANLLAPPPAPPSSSRSSRISKQMVIKTIEKHPWWLGVLAFVTVVSLAANGIAMLALRSMSYQLQVARSRVVTGSVVTSAPGSAGAQTETSACAGESSGLIGGSDRDRMLFDAIRQHEMGHHQEALLTFKGYARQSCDAATLETISILERELAPAKKDPGR